MTRLLDSINSPADIRRLSATELERLAADIRGEIIRTVSQTGGHLAPSLGVVELTLAIHHVFNTPEDRLIWDVGHQCYAHKLVTGRRGRFHTLRQHDGLSGFPKREESPYDVFDTGHSSTSISAGLGISLGLDLQKKNHRVIAVIGDGSLTGGMAFEALNHAGHLEKNLIVILNDNEMSISPNVGALSSFLSRKLTGRAVTRLKRKMEHFLKNFSHVGENILTFLKKSEESLKVFLTPGILFEALKFEYVGPLPGHDLPGLIETLANIRDYSSGPVLVHVLTTKGKGYPPAESRPDRFHGVGPFDVVSGDSCGNTAPAAGGPAYCDVFGEALVRLAAKNDKVCAITAAMCAGTGLSGFAARFPQRFFDVGIAEQHAVTFAAGLAVEGMRPVVAIYSTFLQRALDQVIHDVCLQNLPVVFAIDRGGVVGDDGPTHHGVFDLSFLRFIPNLVLMAPRNENELGRMLATALAHPGPSAIRYPRGKGPGRTLDDLPEPFAIGRGEVLKGGSDILLLPVGARVDEALHAATELEKAGIGAAVLDPRFVKPLDEELICHWAVQTARVLTVEDNAGAGGFGSAVLELFARRGIAARCRCLGFPDRFIEHGSQQELWRKYQLDLTAIIDAAHELCAAP